MKSSAFDDQSLSSDANEIRARQAFKFPLDPMNVVTMSDYDLSLLMFRNWFNFDNGRSVLPDLISAWKFDSKQGEYEFMILPEAKWSDGKSISPNDLFLNLQRVIESGSPYAQAISEIIDLSSFKSLSNFSFCLKTKSGKPTDAFFQRMGSIFLAVASPEDFGDPNQLSSNKFSGGPYKLVANSDAELIFDRNPYFKPLVPQPAKLIRIRRPNPEFNIFEFLDGRTWENYVQVSTLIPPEAASKLTINELPFWTRNNDRVSVLKPLGSGPKLEKLRAILKALAHELGNSVVPQSPMNVQRAYSLQPTGYPLFQTIDFPKPTVSEFNSETITILAAANDIGEFHRQFIIDAANRIGVHVDWRATEVSEYYKRSGTTTDYDFLLLSYGVADPEAATWMAFLFSDKNFITFTPEDRQEYARISASETSAKTISGYKGLLEKIALEGGYVPLFHFSTLSIGQKGMSFKAIRELDETVNLSKITFE